MQIIYKCHMQVIYMPYASHAHHMQADVSSGRETEIASKTTWLLCPGLPIEVDGIQACTACD